MARDLPDREPGATTRTALTAFVIISTMYAMATIVLMHLLRPGDDPLSSPISQYAVGRFGFLMTACLILWGMAGWALAAALSLGSPGQTSRVGLGLLVFFGAGLIVAGIVSVDVPYDMWNLSRTGAVHVVCASVSTASFPFAALLVSDRRRGDQASALPAPSSEWLLRIILAVMPAVFLSACFLPAVFGLVQKIYAVLVLQWMLLGSLRGRPRR
jgi:hypothetical protein